MAETEQNLPPRPVSFPRLVPGKIDVFRLVSLALTVIAIALQISLIYVRQDAKNDIGALETMDPIGFPFVR